MAGHRLRQLRGQLIKDPMPKKYSNFIDDLLLKATHERFLKIKSMLTALSYGICHITMSFILRSQIKNE